MAEDVDERFDFPELDELPRSELEQLVRSLTQELDHLNETVDHVILTINAWGTIQRVNDELAAVLGIDPDEVIGESIDTVMADEADLEDDVEYLPGTAVAGMLIAEEDLDRPVAFCDVDGTAVPMRVESATIRTEEDEIEGFVLVATPVGQPSPRERSLRQRSEQTELLNQIVRHDIRNDANVINESVRRLRRLNDDGDELDEETANLLDQIEGAANRIVDLTERVRDLMQAFEELDRELVSVNLGDVLIEEIAYATTIAEKGTVELTDEVPDVEVNANEMLSSVVQNLLSNAIEHSDQDEPTVTVGVEIAEETVVLTIADDGPGLSESVRDSLNEDTIDLDQFGTTSFGLYIVQTLIERYGGELEAEDRDPRGTTFRVTLNRA